MTFKRKSNHAEVSISEVVYDRRGRRYYVDSLHHKTITGVSMDSRRIHVTERPEFFGCYQPHKVDASTSQER